MDTKNYICSCGTKFSQRQVQKGYMQIDKEGNKFCIKCADSKEQKNIDHNIFKVV